MTERAAAEEVNHRGLLARSAVGMGSPWYGYGYDVGMGIEIPSPWQPCWPRTNFNTGMNYEQLHSSPSDRKTKQYTTHHQNTTNVLDHQESLI